MKRILAIAIGCFILLGLVQATPKPKKTAPRRYAPILWVDAGANLDRTNSREDIAKLLEQCKETGIKTIMMDVKPGSGLVIYKSKIAPRLLQWKGKSYNPDFDRLQVFVEEGHKRGLNIVAAFFVFSEGHQIFKVGPVYDTHPEWASVLLTHKGLVPIIQVPNKTAKVNPVNPEVKRYELSLMEEVVKNYNVDGILLDGCRFDGHYTDFSDISHREFEKYLFEQTGKRQRIQKWPNEVMSFDPKTSKLVKGALYNDWILFRAKVIYDFVAKTRKTMKAINPKILVTTYGGAWYPSYSEVGVNWASKTFVPPADWAPKGYEKYGYAELLDFYCSGCYNFDVTKEEAIQRLNVKSEERQEAGMSKNPSWWYSVEGFSEITKTVLKNACPGYGTLYVYDYRNNPRQFVRAMDMAKRKTDGLALFDLSQVDGYDYWKWIKLALSKSRLTEKDIQSVPESILASPVHVPPNTTEDFAIDNTDPQCTVKGAWRSSSDITGYLGKDYLVHDVGTTGDFLQWKPFLPLKGKFRVAVSYTSGDNRSTHVTYSVICNGDTIPVIINQKEKGGQWVELGTWQFDNDSTASVKVSADTDDGVVIADAVRFTRID